MCCQQAAAHARLQSSKLRPCVESGRLEKLSEGVGSCQRSVLQSAVKQSNAPAKDFGLTRTLFTLLLAESDQQGNQITLYYTWAPSRDTNVQLHCARPAENVELLRAERPLRRPVVIDLRCLP